MEDKVRVLLIAGSGRSGSTLLDNVLGCAEGVMAAGEVRYVWERGLVENRLCGCGEHFRSCPFWQSVLSEAFGDVERIDVAAALGAIRDATRVRQLPMMLRAARRGSGPDASVRELTSQMSRIYRSVRDVSGADLVVDSSKLPAYGFLLDRTPGIDLRVLHLVRDPRATAFSWSSRKEQPDRATQGLMERRSAVKTAVLWDIWNVTAGALWSREPGRYQLLRYEDFVAAPRTTVEQVLDSLGIKHASLPFADDTTVELGGNHTVAGNPSRFSAGRVSIQSDRRWQTEMNRRDRAVVSLLTAPVRSRYGYGRTLDAKPLAPTSG